MSEYQKDPAILAISYYSKMVSNNDINSLTIDQLDKIENVIKMLKKKLNDRSNIGFNRLNQDIKQVNMISEKKNLPVINNGNMTRNFRSEKNLNNPYSYGADHNMLDPSVNVMPQGPYYNNPDVMKDMGLNPNDGIRKTDIESSLIYSEATHTPGQNALTNTEMYRFNTLPFDPQRVVWNDNMPRGGYSTRINNNAQYINNNF